MMKFSGFVLDSIEEQLNVRGLRIIRNDPYKATPPVEEVRDAIQAGLDLLRQRIESAMLEEGMQDAPLTLARNQARRGI